MKRILIVVVVLSGTAAAQPGATPPVEAQGAPVESQPQAGAAIDLDDLLARAQAASPTLETIARGSLRRARRAIALGPTVGLWGGGVLAQDEGEYAVTFGLGLETFKVPVLPTLDTLKQLVMERAKAKLKDQLVARLAGQAPDPISAEQFAREVWEEAVQEVLGLQNVRAKTMERPALNVALEVNRLFKSDAWAPRLRLGFGVWKVTLGASLSIGLGNDALPKTPVYTGLEVVTHFLTSPNPRSSVVDVFVRADFEMRNRDTNTDQLVLGVRYLFDVI